MVPPLAWSSAVYKSKSKGSYCPHQGQPAKKDERRSHSTRFRMLLLSTELQLLGLSFRVFCKTASPLELVKRQVWPHRRFGRGHVPWPAKSCQPERHPAALKIQTLPASVRAAS
eukprot:TRINITY_DN63396_c0_g1_i1.p3 TRINITY_DN63396_c0_g1~~TRINITY_DN63396_c0_g1_i1.p3  ORF type:complete len:114 (+),score=9.93 TRINITY_DN63396_c0_g1_i1:594-935(+)